jgi:hypothetical protein
VRVLLRRPLIVARNEDYPLISLATDDHHRPRRRFASGARQLVNHSNNHCHAVTTRVFAGSGSVGKPV